MHKRMIQALALLGVCAGLTLAAPVPAQAASTTVYKSCWNWNGSYGVRHDFKITTSTSVLGRITWVTHSSGAGSSNVAWRGWQWGGATQTSRGNGSLMFAGAAVAGVDATDYLGGRYVTCRGA